MTTSFTTNYDTKLDSCVARFPNILFDLQPATGPGFSFSFRDLCPCSVGPFYSFLVFLPFTLWFHFLFCSFDWPTHPYGIAGLLFRRLQRRSIDCGRERERELRESHGSTYKRQPVHVRPCGVSVYRSWLPFLFAVWVLQAWRERERDKPGMKQLDSHRLGSRRHHHSGRAVEMHYGEERGQKYKRERDI